MPSHPSSSRVLLPGNGSAGRAAHRVPAMRSFGGIRFPDREPPAPGPLTLLARQLVPPAPPSTPSVQRMLAALPPHLATRRLEAGHPRVLERLAAVWRDPRALRETFDELMFESGPSRQCLDFEAVVELTELKDYVIRNLYGHRASVWDEALGLG